MFNQRRLWIWVLAILIGLGLIYAAFQLDDAVRHWQQAHRLRNHQELSRMTTRVTDWPVHVVAGLLLAGLAWWRGKKGWAAIFLSMVVAALLAGVTAYGLKVAIGRPRPAVKMENTESRGNSLRPNYQAFPSGHSAASAAFFGVLIFAGWRLGLAFFLVPVAIGASRVLLGAHHLSDVVGGLVLGLLCAGLVATFACRWTERGRKIGQSRAE